MRPVVPQRILFTTIAVALAAACEEPPPDGAADRLFASASNARVVQGQTTKITVTSLTAAGAPGEGSASATVAPATAAAIAAEGAAPTEATASVTLASGIGVFDFRCAEDPAQTEDVAVTVSVTGPTGAATATVTCIPQVEVRQIAVDTTNCDTFLQADGASSCTVGVTVRDQVGVAVSGAVLAVDVDAATLAAGGDGNPRVLKAAATDTANNTLRNITTDAAGTASFIVVSPAFGLEQSVDFTVRDDAGNSEPGRITIAPFEDKSAVTLTALETSISSQQSTTVTVSALDFNATPAAGKIATLTLTGGLVATANACLVIAGETLTATLDASGRCAFDVTAPDVGLTAVDTTVKASFQAAAQGEPRADTLTIAVNPLGVSIATPIADPSTIFADAEPSISTISVSLKLDGDPLANARVTATIASNSVGVIKLTGGANEDVATGTSGSDGVVTFTIAADNPLSRGTGKVTITAVDAANAAIDVIDPVELSITVNRAPLLSSLVFEGFDPGSVIGVPGGPRPSSTGVSFKLLDEENAPVANVPVRFVAQSSVPGVAIVPFDTSDAAGVVSTVVTAGLVAGPITVVAIIDSPALSAVAPAISVIGGLPNSGYSSLTCETIAALNPSTSCTVALADKFTNVVETTLNVQFRAEGGNITPSAEAAGGTAEAAFTAGPPGAGSADVQGWSYSAIRTPPSAVVAAFPGCFDRTTRTDCDLLALCSPAANDPNRAAFEAFCPLPRAVGGAGSCAADISATTRQAMIDEGNNPGDWELELLSSINALAAIDVDAQFTAYAAEQRVCGFPVGCLVGDADGLGLDPSDDCPVNAGCLDYSGATECPQNGLLDILAAVRGEEAYVDTNGDGVRGGTPGCVPGVDAGCEDFVDFPEPFLDKNSSCSFDDLNDNIRLTAGQKVQLSDLFIDSNSTDGSFGFNLNGVRRETNTTFDSDTEIFLKTSIVQLGAGALTFGQPTDADDCGADGNDTVACSGAAGRKPCALAPATDICPALGLGTCLRSAGNVAFCSLPIEKSCTEIATGSTALLTQCLPEPKAFRDGESLSFGFRWSDANGNCPSDNFAGQVSVTVEGPAIIAADDGPHTAVECGAQPGGANSKNPERAWCEEHRDMGAPIRNVTVSADCGADTGIQTVKLTFGLDDQVATRLITVTCPTCGDGAIEGEEKCDDGNKNEGDGCPADCAEAEEGFTCVGQPSVCSGP